MKLFEIFKTKPTMSKRELVILMKAADEAPAQLERLGRQMEELEIKLLSELQELQEGCAKLLK